MLRGRRGYELCILSPGSHAHLLSFRESRSFPCAQSRVEREACKNVASEFGFEHITGERACLCLQRQHSSDLFPPICLLTKQISSEKYLMWKDQMWLVKGPISGKKDQNQPLLFLRPLHRTQKDLPRVPCRASSQKLPLQPSLTVSYDAGKPDNTHFYLIM